MEKLKPLIEGVGWVKEKFGVGFDWVKEKVTDGYQTGVMTAAVAGSTYANLKANGGGGLLDMGRVAASVATNDNGLLKSRFGELAGQGSGLAAARPRLAPDMPAALPRGVQGAVQQQQTNHISITQQPGQSSQQLAQQVADELQRRQAVNARATLADTR